ncbi:MAG: hypothetical protein ACFFDN_05000 [Candidatus Hodarchaeota archaeon]
MEKFKYQVETLKEKDYSDFSLQLYLNKLGKKGYELIHYEKIWNTTTGVEIKLIFKTKI